jgi:iron complex transport system ATP-binding protein
MANLEAAGLSLGFGDRRVIEKLGLCVEQGMMLAIVGRNGSGKSTLIRALSRNLKPQAGAVYLDGKDIAAANGKEVARRLAVLMQRPSAPGDMTVGDLVECGRFPHQSWWRSRAAEDRRMVDWALEQAGMASMRDRPVTTLSGGESQRAWLAMALAQQPEVFLLDEPTTYLDLCHQIEVMQLLGRLNKQQGIAVVMVLHDINHAARYADAVAVLHEGRIAALGPPAQVINRELLRRVFGVEASINPDGRGRPVVVVDGLAAGGL